MWVQVGGTFFNTDHIMSVQRHDDAGVYYILRFSHGEEVGFNEDQIKPLVEALNRMADSGKNRDHVLGSEPGKEHTSE